MKISLENWLRNKLHENEEMLDYAVATDTVRCWIDEYKEIKDASLSRHQEGDMKTAEEILKDNGIYMTDFISSSSHQGVINAMKAYAQQVGEQVRKDAAGKTASLSNQYPYKNKGDRESYSDYRQGMNDAFGLAEQSILETEIKLP